MSPVVSQRRGARGLVFVKGTLRELRLGDRPAQVLPGAEVAVEHTMSCPGELGAMASLPCSHQASLQATIESGGALLACATQRRIVVPSASRPTLGVGYRPWGRPVAQHIRVDVVPLGLLLGPGPGSVSCLCPTGCDTRVRPPGAEPPRS